MTNPRYSKVQEINAQNRQLRDAAEGLFLGLVAQFRDGRYKGRWGLVTAVALDDRAGVTCLVQPFRMEICDPATGRPAEVTGVPIAEIGTDDLLYQHIDARSYRPVDQYNWKDDYEPCRACNRRVASPCHDAEGYHEGGPWDGSCRDVFYPERSYG